MANERDRAGIARRWQPVRREEERVTPLELFFDLVFVLAVTRCTALMAADPTWLGLLKTGLILGLIWWTWVGYSWLTSVVNPEEGMVRGAMFAAMGALLIVSLCIPRAMNATGLTFAIAYSCVRIAHIALFITASKEDQGLRSSVKSLGVSTVIGVSLLIGGAFLHDGGRVALWLAALVFDAGGGFIADSTGWRLSPVHFAERHGLIVLIALGESIVAVGVGAGSTVHGFEVISAITATALAAAIWWVYFDVVALDASRRLAGLTKGKEQNEMARDSYSFLHFPMVAGIVLVAYGTKSVLGHTHDHLHSIPRFALLGGVAIYLLAHVAFRLRNTRTVNKERLILGLVLLLAIPLTNHLNSVLALVGAAGVLWLMIGYEARHFSQGRHEVRHAEGIIPPSY